LPFEKIPAVPYGTCASKQLSKETHMIRTMGAAALLALLTTMPAQHAAAQDPFSVLGGAAAGAAIGGAATGRAGGAVAGAIIGGATGAAISAEAERRRGGYYWYNSGCYARAQGGYVRVARRYCY
jgi:type IV secretory pathway TrbL component